jgi:hypothetical protein
VKRTNYDRHWKHTYKGPGFKAHLLAIVVFLVPKIGGASDLAIKIPDAQTQNLYLKSVNHTVDAFRESLFKAISDRGGPIELANLDLDTGHRDVLGEYELADQAYSKLLERLTAEPQRSIPADLKKHILNYYASAAGSSLQLEQTSAKLNTLKEMKTGSGGE